MNHEADPMKHQDAIVGGTYGDLGWERLASGDSHVNVLDDNVGNVDALLDWGGHGQTGEASGDDGGELHLDS